MTNQELKEALLEHKAVNYGGIRYQVHGILYRAKETQITVAVELLLLLLGIGICGGAEFALDKTNLSNWLVYGGMLVALIPLLVLAAFALFFIIVCTFHYISLGSICAAAFLLAAVWFPCAILSNPDGYRNLPQCAMVAIVAVFAIWKHRTNISRLIAGNENKFRWRT